MKPIQPHLFIPGAAKSGTTTLHELLDVHPDICMSSVKEPVFWNKTEHRDKQIEKYNALFTDTSATILGESTTSYMYYPIFTEQVKAHFETTPKFIFILRNPIDRCYSHYWWMVGRGQEKRSFKESFKNDMERPYAEHGYTPDFYYHFGLYHHWIQRFYDNFPQANIKVITLEALIEDRQKTINQCFEFLGLKKLEDIPEIIANKSYQLKNAGIYHFIRKLSVRKNIVTYLAGRLLSKKRRDNIKQNLQDMRYFKKDNIFEYPEMTQEDRTWLKSVYEQDFNALRQLTGLEFNEWTDFKD